MKRLHAIKQRIAHGTCNFNEEFRRRNDGCPQPDIGQDL